MVLFAILLALAVGSSALWLAGILAWSRQRTALPGYLPSVTVLVAGRNEEMSIEACLNSLLRQDYPTDLYRVLFINDHSTDRTASIARSVAGKYPDRIEVLSAPENSGKIGPKKSALQYGIGRATGTILAFTDADCTVHSGWLRALISEYDARTGAVAGAVLPVEKRGMQNRLFWLERLLIGYTTASAMGCGTPASATGTSLSYRRELFEQVKDHAHPTWPSGDDDLMVQAIARAGFEVRFSHHPDCIATDHRPQQWKRLMLASIRHQSTVRFYPLRWRLLYIWSIAANILLLGLLAAAIMRPAFIPPAAIAVAVKTVCDGIGVALFSHRMKIRVSLFDFLIAQIALPAYLIGRPVLAGRNRFSWSQRQHVAGAVSLNGPVG